LLRDSPDRGGDFRDEHLVQVGIGRVPRQKEDRPAPHWEWQARPPDLVLLHRRLRPRDTGGFRSQTRGSNQASSALSGTLRYASAVARSRSSRIAFWMAARMKAERRRDRAGAICSSFLNVSSSTSTSNCFMGSTIGKNSEPDNIEPRFSPRGPRHRAARIATPAPAPCADLRWSGSFMRQHPRASLTCGVSAVLDAGIWIPPGLSKPRISLDGRFVRLLYMRLRSDVGIREGSGVVVPMPLERPPALEARQTTALALGMAVALLAAPAAAIVDPRVFKC